MSDVVCHLTEVIIRSKRFRINTKNRNLFISLANKALLTAITLLFGFGASELAYSIDSKRLPVLHHVGIIPIQWQGSSQNLYGLETSRKHIDTAFSVAIRNSQRFHVLSDDLVKELWDSPAGRLELRNDYELSAFVNIAAAPLEDSVVLVARILEPDLSGLMQESETIDRLWLSTATYDQVEKKVSDLLYKLTNRIPIDVTITSVQGQYVTFSGGLTKGIHEGDILKIIRSKVSNRHPATKFWMNFESKYLGKAEIIESKQHTSVARLIDQVKEGSVEIGDGSKINSIAGRTRFARPRKKRRFADTSDTIIVPPLYDSISGMPNQPVKMKSKNKNKKSSFSDIKKSNGTENTEKNENTSQIVNEPASGKTPSTDSAEQGSSPDTTQPATEITPDDGGIDFTSPFAFSNVTSVVSKVADRITFHVGQHIWTYTGPGSTGSDFVYYLPVNTAGARIIRQIIPNVKYGMGGGIGGGKSENAGSYFTYDSHIRVFWESKIGGHGSLIEKFQAGGQANFSGLSVEGEKFGGGDWIQVGFFGGITGTIQSQSQIDWYGELTVTPMSFGQIGYGGSQKSLKSSLGWKGGLGGYLATGEQQLEWGGGLEYSFINFQDNDNNALGMTSFNLQGLARYRF